MKIINQEQLKKLVKDLKSAQKTVVFTNGCFDILHAGHVRYLQAARQLGDILILGLNGDISVKALKGPTRPINTEDDRAEVLAGLEAVDYITIFDENTAENLINIVQPHIYAKGGDYEIEQIPEAKVVHQYGGKVTLVPEVKGRSSTKIINKIKGD